MSLIQSKQDRVLAIASSHEGFGFAVCENNMLIDWGVKWVTGDKNINSVKKVKGLIAQYEPHIIILEDSQKSLRAVRIRRLDQKIVALAKNAKVRVKVLSREQVRQVFFGAEKGTKYALAEILAERFPEELGFRLPRKRRPWMSEDHRMAMFDAVALAVVLFSVKAKSHPCNVRQP